MIRVRVAVGNRVMVRVTARISGLELCLVGLGLGFELDIVRHDDTTAACNTS